MLIAAVPALCTLLALPDGSLRVDLPAPEHGATEFHRPEDPTSATKRAGTGVPEEIGGELDELADSLQVDHLIARVAEGGFPYVDIDAFGPSQLFVVGRSGQLVWNGDPVAREKDFLEALARALTAYPAPPYEGPVPEALEAPLALYHAGDYQKARKSAEKIRSKANEEEADALKAFLLTVETLERDLLLEARDAVTRRRPVKLFDAVRAIDTGFPRSDLAKRAEELVESTTRDWRGSGFVDTQRYVEFRDERPPLFPVRRSSKGKAFAKKLEKFLKKTGNDMDVTRRARALLEAYKRAR